MCLFESCQNEAWSRGLCATHYTFERRNGELQEWPTKNFMSDPESHIRWAFAHFPELVAEVAPEFGKRVSEL